MSDASHGFLLLVEGDCDLMVLGFLDRAAM